MRRTINKERVEGRVYDMSQLALKTVQNSESKHFGEEFIGGSIDIATDDDCLNIVTVYFTFVQPTYNSGKVNSTFGVLKNLIDSGKSVLTDGKDNATMIRIDAALGLNDFYTSRNGEETLVSAKRNMGRIANIVSKLSEEDARNTFECDMLINGTRVVEANEERNIPEDYLIVKGAVFNFKNEILPVEFTVRNKGGMKYFEDLEPSPKNLIFTSVWGQIVSQEVVVKKTSESAWGDDDVVEYKNSRREYVITGTAREPYDMDDEAVGFTPDELKELTQNREVHLAEVKEKFEEYRTSQKAGKNKNGAKTEKSDKETAAAEASDGGFNFF